MQGLPIVISAPSGTGKTTLSKLLLDANSNSLMSVSFTTREPRKGEENGIDYNFVSEKQFLHMVDTDQLVEWAEVHGFFYGTSKTWIHEQVDAGKDVILVLDVKGGRQLKRTFPSAILVFLVPPEFSALEERLRRRGTDSEEIIQKRLAAAKDEIATGLKYYDYVVTNAQIQTALQDILSIVRTHKIQMVDRHKIFDTLI